MLESFSRAFYQALFIGQAGAAGALGRVGARAAAQAQAGRGLRALVRRADVHP